MYVDIGMKKEGGDVIDLLLDCHARIRRFSELALRIAEAEGAPEQEVAEAAARVRRYFSVALPHHVADEEESILPRLMGKDAALDAALHRMEEEHEGHAKPLREVVELCAELSERPARLPELCQVLAPVAARLVEEFEVHLEAEEAIVLPALREKLSEQERQAIFDELRARRKAV